MEERCRELCACQGPLVPVTSCMLAPGQTCAHCCPGSHTPIIPCLLCQTTSPLHFVCLLATTKKHLKAWAASSLFRRAKDSIGWESVTLEQGKPLLGCPTSAKVKKTLSGPGSCPVLGMETLYFLSWKDPSKRRGWGQRGSVRGAIAVRGKGVTGTTKGSPGHLLSSRKKSL